MADKPKEAPKDKGKAPAKAPSKPEKPKTPEEERRDIALKNLKASSLMNIASAYLVHKSGQFGEAGDSAMEMYKYFPAFSAGTKAYAADGTEYNVLQNSILGSRSDGQRYSGNVSEMKIMKDCAAIVQESLNAVKISDVMGFMGSKVNVQDAYLGNLLPPKMSEEEMSKLTDDQKKALKAQSEIYQNIVASYQTYLATKNVSDALAESAKEIPKGLEKLLAVPDKKKEGKK